MQKAISVLAGPELGETIAATPALLVWFDGTPAGSGYTFLGFARIMEPFAECLRGRVVTVLLDVDEWGDHALERGVYGAPELVLFSGGAEVDRFIGKATLPELLLWISPHVAHSLAELQALYPSRSSAA